MGFTFFDDLWILAVFAEEVADHTSCEHIKEQRLKHQPEVGFWQHIDAI
jgi:hypothetical protein